METTMVARIEDYNMNRTLYTTRQSLIQKIQTQ